MKRLITAAVGAVALVVAGASVALIGGSSASQAAGTPSQAYGIQATGLIPIDKAPVTVSDDGRLHEDSVASFPANPLLTGGIVTTRAANGEASASVADLGVGGGLLDQIPDLSEQLSPLCDALKQVDLGAVNDQITGPDGTLLPDVLGPIVEGVDPNLDLSLITALDLGDLLPDDLSGLCDVLSGKAGLVGAEAVTAECHGNAGSLTVANLTALGLPVQIDTNTVNSKVEVPGVLTITANRQTRNSNGTFTVDGLVINLLGQQEIVITSATCGRITSADPTPDPTDSPTPVPTRFPVTG